MLSALADLVKILNMECNKDEATRAKSIAESKLEQKDFLGAKKFTLKAQTLYPGLYGIPQLLTTLDVYLSAENKISGQVDWYRVLSVNPSDDYDTIKKQYKKLALMLHPDKNTSVGADGAFQLVSEAWRLLSDKEKRAAYNQRRGYKGLQQNVPTHTGGPSAPCRPHQQKVPAYTCGKSVPPRPSQQKVPSASPRRSKKKVPSAPSRPSQPKVPSAPPRPSQHKTPAHTSGPSVPPCPSQQKVSTQMGCSSTPSMGNQFLNFASSTTSNQKSQSKTAKMPRTQNPAPPHHRSDTFWTVCRGCNTHFEYLKIYCNHTLLCRRCEKPFLALEIAPPVKFSKSVKPVPWVRQEHSFKNLPGQNAYDPKGNVAVAQKPGAGQTRPNSFTYTNYQQGPLPETASTAAEKPGNVVQQAHGNLKRSHIESHASADLEKCFKKGKLDDDSNGYGTNHNIAQGNFGTEVVRGAGFYGFSGTCSQPSSTRELPRLETRELLMLNTQKEILKKLSDSRL